GQHRDRPDGVPLVADLPLAPARRGRHRVPADVPAGGARTGVRVRHAVGVADLPDSDLRHALAPAHRLPHRVSAPGYPDDLRGDAPDRPVARGVRPDVRGALGLPDADGDDAPAAPRPHRRLAPAVHRQRARARRVHLADGPQGEGHHAGHRRVLVLDEHGADGGHGPAADAGGGRGPDRALPGRAPRRTTPRRVSVEPAARPTPAAIEVRDLVVRYGGVTAVRGATFSVGAGEHLTLLGPSGCGKTTTLRAIAGLE